MSTNQTQQAPAYLAKQGESAPDLKSILNSENMRKQFSLALPKHLSPDRFVRVATTALTRTPKLTQCTQASFFRCLLELSAYGLEPDGRRAHLIPYGNECTLIIDYKGLAELALRSGNIAKLHADIVCENDTFVWNLGVIQQHTISFKTDRGKPYAAYAYAETKDGAVFCEVLTATEIYSIRDRSQGWLAFKSGKAKQSPWDPSNPTSEREMMKKTAFRRLSKWLPLSAEFRDATENEDTEDFIDISAQTLPEPKAPQPALTAPRTKPEPEQPEAAAQEQPETQGEQPKEMTEEEAWA